MRSSKPIGLGLLVAATAMMVMAFAAQSASATEIKPANTKITAKLVAGTNSRFLPKNAYGKIAVFCKEAEATFTTPPSTEQPAGMKQNQNRAGTGTFSQSQGSVSSQVETTKFEKCTVRELSEAEPHSEGKEIGTATVTTIAGWTLAGWGLNANEAIIAMGVPKEGAVIKTTVSGASCTITVGESQQSVVMGTFTNANGVARFDGQLKYTVSGLGCLNLGEQSPAQYEAEYATAPAGLEIIA